MIPCDTSSDSPTVTASPNNDVTSTTRPTTRIFSMTVRAARFQGWNSAKKLRLAMVAAVARAAQAKPAEWVAGNHQAVNAIASRMARLPASLNPPTERRKKNQPMAIETGTLRRT